MWQCWQRNPTDRPHFAVVHESLEELLESKIVSSQHCFLLSLIIIVSKLFRATWTSDSTMDMRTLNLMMPHRNFQQHYNYSSNHFYHL